MTGHTVGPFPLPRPSEGTAQAAAGTDHERGAPPH